MTKSKKNSNRLDARAVRHLFLQAEQDDEPIKHGDDFKAAIIRAGNWRYKDLDSLLLARKWWILALLLDWPPSRAKKAFEDAEAAEGAEQKKFFDVVYGPA